MKHQLAGSRIILTGASSGIGSALTLHLAEEGANLLITARRAERLDDLIKKIRQQFPDYANGTKKIISVCGDITAEETRSEIIETAKKELGGVDILINNAGAGATSLFEITTVKTARYMMELNYFAVFELTQLALPFLKEAAKPSERTSKGIHPLIVNIASIVGLRGVPHYSAYGPAKFAVSGFSESLRAELHKEKIDVLLVCPGTTKTEFFDVLLQSDKVPLPAHAAVMPEYVAGRIVKAMKKGKAKIIPYFFGVVLDYMNRFAPRLTDWIMRKFV